MPRAVWELNLLFSPLECLDSCARRYGDPFRVGGRRAPPAVYFSHPTAIQQILTADPVLYEARRGDRVRRFLHGDNALQYLSGNAISGSDGCWSGPSRGATSGLWPVREITQEVTRVEAGAPFRCERPQS
jgi:hypothetical protein